MLDYQLPATSYQLPALDVRTLTEAGRVEVLRCLSTRLAGWAESELTPTLRQPRADARFTVGHVEVLALMARDIEDTYATGPAEREQEPPANWQGQLYCLVRLGTLLAGGLPASAVCPRW